jgi:hypothetical protein
MTTKRSTQPLDRAASLAMLLLVIIIAAMLLLGARALPKVRTFSWQNQAVAADDVAFMMTFTQPMDPQSVQDNLTIEPPLLGKFSWAGRKMAYTLAVPAPYGETYKVSLPNAKALGNQVGFEPFSQEFRTHDRVFAYIGAQGDEEGRLILFNLTRKEKTLLTPADQTVMDYRIYPERDRILYLANAKPDPNDPNSNDPNSTILSPQLYRVSTGINDAVTPPRWQFWQSRKAQSAGDLELLLDNKGYQNLKFDLSANGKVVVIQRVNQDNPTDFGPWVLAEGDSLRKLETEPGGDFRIAPDSESLLLQQGQGTAVIALTGQPAEADGDELLDFLPDYGQTLDIANDGSAAAMVNFNQDDPNKQFTQTLFWVSNRGQEKPLLDTNGAILSAQFNEDNTILYCLVNRLLEGQAEYAVVPYLTAVNVETGKAKKLLEMPPQQEITVNLSPDGLAILFDEALVGDESANGSASAGAKKPQPDSIAAASMGSPTGTGPNSSSKIGSKTGSKTGAETTGQTPTPPLEGGNIAPPKPSSGGQTSAQVNAQNNPSATVPPPPASSAGSTPSVLPSAPPAVNSSDTKLAEEAVPQGNNTGKDTGQNGEALGTHRLWLLPLYSTLDERIAGEPMALSPTQLEISGRQPTWLP